MEHPFETVIGPNIRGLYHAYEAARREGARMIFASSNHAVGFHTRSAVLDDDCSLAPDGFYGLSKAYGELMGGLYRDKHGVESVFLRIGSCFPEPTRRQDAGDLAVLRRPDPADRPRHPGAEPRTGRFGGDLGASNNSRMTWWRRDGRAVIGWTRKTARIPTPRLWKARPAATRWSSATGRRFAGIDYSRAAPPR